MQGANQGRKRVQPRGQSCCGAQMVEQEQTKLVPDHILGLLAPPEDDGTSRLSSEPSKPTQGS
jgi:hypothetical protein